MKNITAKKIVLYSIALLGATMLLVGLCFDMLNYDLGLSGETSSLVQDVLDMKASGFDMLSFKFPLVLNSLLLTVTTTRTVNIWVIVCGVLSVIALLFAIASIITLIVSFFVKSSENSEKITITFGGLGVLVSGICSVVGIVMSIIFNDLTVKYYEKYASMYGSEYAETMTNFGTSMWVSLIIQVALFVALLICNKVDFSKNTANAKAQQTSGAKTHSQSHPTLVEALVSEEKSVIEAIRGYKVLFDEGIITSAEFLSKKARLLSYSDKVIKSRLVAMKNKVGCANLEMTIIELIKEYKALFDQEILTSVEFVEKKSALLQYVID